MYGHESRQMMLADVDCDGDESSLEECRHGMWGETSCDPQSEAAGVQCQGRKCCSLQHTGHTIMYDLWTVNHPLQKRGLLFLTKRLPRKRNQNWRTFDNFQKVIVYESQ